MPDPAPPQDGVKPYKLKDIGNFLTTVRTVEEYSATFGFNPSELKKNAQILDVGSGTNQDFARSLAGIRPDIKVVSVDPSLALPDKKKLKEQNMTYTVAPSIGQEEMSFEEVKEKRLKEAASGTTAAIAPHLPFKDDVFDYIYDNHGAYLYYPSDNHAVLKKYIQELLRVTKSGGTIGIFPLDHFRDTFDFSKSEEKRFQQSKVEITKILDEMGIKSYEVFELEYGPSPDSQQKKYRAGVRITNA